MPSFLFACCGSNVRVFGEPRYSGMDIVWVETNPSKHKIGGALYSGIPSWTVGRTAALSGRIFRWKRLAVSGFREIRDGLTIQVGGKPRVAFAGRSRDQIAVSHRKAVWCRLASGPAQDRIKHGPPTPGNGCGARVASSGFPLARRHPCTSNSGFAVWLRCRLTTGESRWLKRFSFGRKKGTTSPSAPESPAGCGRTHSWPVQSRPPPQPPAWISRN